MSTTVTTFADALADAETRMVPRSILLGNGFSIDWKRDIFAYESLMDEADLGDLSVNKADLFLDLGSTDFERVVDFMNKAAALADLYGARDPNFADTLRADAEAVKNGLANAIATRHPDRPSDVGNDEAECARLFLSNFDTIFTLSYDLLLYWLINRSTGSACWVPAADGFNWPTREDQSTLIFKRSVANSKGRVFWLHGGLHLFVEHDRKLHKLRYEEGPLVDQLRARLDDGTYPLVVTEGTSAEKRAKIGQSGYLTYANNRLRDLAGCLFMHGLSLSENDDHILEALSDRESDVEAVYVGVHGDANTRANRWIVDRAEELADTRRTNGGRDLDLRFYDTSSAHVWR